MNSLGDGRTDRVLRWIERALVVTGIACLLWVGTSSLSAIAYQLTRGASLERDVTGGTNVDGVKRSAVADHADSIGRLEIPRLGLSAIVAEGDDDKTLKVAVGHLPDTPLPWQDGNTALAGHRDTFFRPLRRIQLGDEVHFATRQGPFRYRVTRHTVVNPDDVWVLDPSPVAALTLITCYPFDFVGPAPKRFVVHAERIANTDDAPAGTNIGEDRR